MDIAVEKFLNKSDYFYCERYHARISRETCIARQEKPRRQRSVSSTFTTPGCENCEQGREIMKGRRDKAEGRRVEAQGLTQLEEQGVVSLLEETNEREKEKRCKKCGEVKLVKDFTKCRGMKDGYENKCKACKKKQAKALREKRKAIAEEQGLVFPRDDGRTKASLVIDFTGHVDVLEKITKDALTNFRTPELQALFLLADKAEGKNNHDR